MRSVLITGGAGFFGRAFVKHLLKHDRADRICVFSRNEWNQAQLRTELQDDYRLRWMVGDVRDSERLEQAMQGVTVVIHAAALKRIEVGEYNPMECVATNVIGTENVIRAAIKTGVRRAVLLSTDKACNPSTTYGQTKALAERLFQTAKSYAGDGGPAFMVCRYGNVAGSTGSIIPIWRRLIADGVTELPITNPDCTRFWMTVQEAVNLVIDVAADGRDGELYTRNLPAYRLGDLAVAMGATGHRLIAMGRGEKLHEEMLPGFFSSGARMMTVPELREALQHV